MRSRRYLAALVACLALAPACGATEATPPRTLGQALTRVPWDAARRGALLVVDPEETRPAAGDQPLPAPRADGYTLRAIAPHFRRKVVFLNTLTVLAPPTMVVLNTRPDAPDPLAGLSRSAKMNRLLASLSPPQWRLLGAARGLGADDLSLEQRTVYLSLLPNPFQPERHTETEEEFSRVEKGRAFSPLERGRVRLRINRYTSLYFAMEGRPDAFTGFVDPRNHRAVGVPYYQVRDREDNSGRSDAHGVLLRQEVSSRLKPGHLAFDAPALSAAVPLTGSATVGDLIRRAAWAARTEMYADARVARLPVWTRGETARAGDVLKALAWAVTGTYRKVGPAFVLTDDVEGIGARRFLLSEWDRDIQARTRAETQVFQRRIAAQAPLQYAESAPDEPFVLTPAQARKIEEGWGARGDKRLEVSGAELTPAQRAHVSQLVAIRNARDKDQRVVGDRISLDVGLRLVYLVSGVGEINTDIQFLASDLLPTPAPVVAPIRTVELPSALATRALYIAPASDEEAVISVREARRRGLNQLWVPEGKREILAAAVKAGAEINLPVYAVVRLLHAVRSHGDPAFGEDTDVNILGESAAACAARRSASAQGPSPPPRGQAPPYTGEWLRPETPATLSLSQRRLRELAALPGLSGIVLRDTAAPGYADPGEEPGMGFSILDDQDFGYAPENRLAFLRQAGIDPVDLGPASPYLDLASLELPFFPTETLEYRQWKAFRHALNTRLLGQLFASVRAEHPNLPLLIHSRPDDSYNLSRWYESWQEAERLPNSIRDYSTPQPRTYPASRRVLLDVSYEGGPFPPPWLALFMGLAVEDGTDDRRSFARLLIANLGMAQGKNGIVLNLSGLPVEKALPLLALLR